MAASIDSAAADKLIADITEASDALDCFFQNKISQCMDILASKSSSSLYHSLGLSAARFMYSVLTFDRSDMDEARDTIKTAIEISNQRRKSVKLSEFFWGQNVEDWTEEQIHAELCYAENHIMLGFLTFAQDQSIFALIKAALRIKIGYDTYMTCQQILNSRKGWPNEILKRHFMSGVYTGVGTSNLILSHLPARLIKVLRWAGFSGEREVAVRNLKAAASMKDGLRFKIVALITISFNLYMEQYYGLGKGDMQWSRELITELHQQFPNGVLVLAFLGRLKQLRGETIDAIKSFDSAISVPIEWKQVHNICYWELIWCYAIQMKWKEAAGYIDTLRHQSKWSRCSMKQIYASMLYMQLADASDEDALALKQTIDQEMSEIPNLRRRIGGKTVPIEKLAIYMSSKYFRRGNSLILPILEIFYFYNIYAHTGGRIELLNPLIELIEKEEQKLPSDADADDICLVQLLKGTCYRYKKDFDSAINCFERVIENQSNIKTDTYIAPHAALELGYVYAEKKDLANAKIWIEKARSDYTHFLVEALVHLRAHGAMREILDAEKYLNEPNSLKSDLVDVPLNEMNELSLIDPTASTKIKRSNVLPSWMGII